MEGSDVQPRLFEKRREKNSSDLQRRQQTSHQLLVYLEGKYDKPYESQGLSWFLAFVEYLPKVTVDH